jgi:hypothetical protein
MEKFIPAEGALGCGFYGERQPPINTSSSAHIGTECSCCGITIDLNNSYTTCHAETEDWTEPPFSHGKHTIFVVDISLVKLG